MSQTNLPTRSGNDIFVKRTGVFKVHVDGNGVVVIETEQGRVVELASKRWDDVTLPTFYDFCRDVMEDVERTEKEAGK